MFTCCSLPRVSVNRRSAHFTSFSLISFSTSLELMPPPVNRGPASPPRLFFKSHHSTPILNGSKQHTNFNKASHLRGVGAIRAKNKPGRRARGRDVRCLRAREKDALLVGRRERYRPRFAA